MDRSYGCSQQLGTSSVFSGSGARSCCTSSTVGTLAKRLSVSFASTSLQWNKLVGINGVLFSALVSGFGAVNCIYVFFNFFSEKTSQADFVSMRQLFFKNARSLVEKKVEILRTRKLVETSQAKASHGLLARVMALVRSESDTLTGRLQFLRSEVFSMETINQQFCLNLYDVLVTKEQHLLAKSCKGKLYSLLARCLVIYGCYRLIFVSST